MKDYTQSVVNIVKSALLQKKNDNLSICFDAPLIALTKKHEISVLIGCGISNCGVKIDGEVKSELQKNIMMELLLNEQQLYYIKKISEEFSEHKIDYMFLKGSVLKKLYPQPEMRRMGDIDILIRENQYNTITSIMKHLGFFFVRESTHELVWRKDKVVVELHKILVPSYNKDFYAYLGNGWERAIKIGNYEYTFKENDMFIYLFIHFAKHFRDTGIGIIHICDLYMYMKKKKLDFAYIESVLKEIELYDFYCNIKTAIEVWFEDKKATDKTDYITSVIFNSGVYGIHENFLISSELKWKINHKGKRRGKGCRFIRTLLPSLESMRGGYAILSNWPILLPFFWIWRLVSKPFIKPESMKQRIKELKGIESQTVDTYEKSLEYVGLKYNFKENTKAW